MKQQSIRHGEVYLRVIDNIPKEAKLVEETKSYIVGHSESGHHHTLTAEAPFKIFELDGRTFIDIPKQAVLEHQKQAESHGTRVIKSSFLERIIHKSYSYADKVMRRVLD